MNRALAVNVSAFAMRYKDMQVSSVEKLPSGQQQVVTGNAATARINGIETEVNWRMSKNDRLMGNFNFLKAEYGDFIACDSTYQDCSRDTINLKGNRLRHTPSFSTTFAFEHDFLMSGGRLTPRLSAHYQTKSYVSEFNQTPGAYPEARQQKAYTTADISVRYETVKKDWLAEVFVMNAGDVAVKTDANLVQGVWTAFYNAPRTAGVRISAKF